MINDLATVNSLGNDPFLPNHHFKNRFPFFIDVENEYLLQLGKFSGHLVSIGSDFSKLFS